MFHQLNPSVSPVYLSSGREHSIFEIHTISRLLQIFSNLSILCMGKSSGKTVDT